MKRAALAAFVVALLLPASASATFYEVNSVGTGLDNVANDNVCQTATIGECTLRAAIEESNTHTGEDIIGFKASVFEGQVADTISSTGLPAITQTVVINGDKGGGGCTTQFGTLGPCVGVSGTGGLTVNNADEVLIRGLAITGATTGINVIGSSEEFTAYDNWLGLGLDGVAFANGTGISLDPDSDDAQIGTINEPDGINGNVFASNSTIGLDILGADDATIMGNYFGVKPDGTSPAGNAQNLEVTGAIGFPSTGTQIGANVTEVVPGSATTAACDGGCNVLGAVAGGFNGAVDLQAESGQNEIPVGEGGLIEGAAIQGNYIGLDATGAAMSASSEVGVMAIKAENVLVGGGEPGEANQIHANGYGVYGENAPNLRVAGNRFGVDPTGTALLRPNPTGVYVFTEAIPPGTNALVTENQIASGESGIGVEIQGAGANVIDNMIGLGKGGQLLGAGGIGVRAWGNIGGSAIEGNEIVDASQVGVSLENAGNSVLDNEIEGSEEAGVRVKANLSPLDGEIGADEADLENEISNTNGPAIELIGEKVEGLVIRGNYGEGNAGPFIDLGGNGPGLGPNPPNQGIVPPVLGSIGDSAVSGTALPGAIVRVFRKSGPSLGELESLIGTAEADGSGKWSLSYGAKLPGKTNVAATQTSNQGTSELVLGVTPPDPLPPVCMCGVLDKTAPKVTIRKAPKAKSTKTTAKFKFVSDEPGSTFKCKLDKKAFANCKSPKTYKKLKPGKHVFKVKASDAAGNVSTVVTRRFTVLAPPQ